MKADFMTRLFLYKKKNYGIAVIQLNDKNRLYFSVIIEVVDHKVNLTLAISNITQTILVKSSG